MALYSAAPSSLKPLLRVSPTAALAQISAEFLRGTPTWWTVLPQDIQNFLVTRYEWRASVTTVETFSEATSEPTTQTSVRALVPGVVSGIAPPVVSGVGVGATISDVVAPTAEPMDIATLVVLTTTQLFQGSTQGPPGGTTVGESSRSSQSTITETSSAPAATSVPSRKDHVLGVAIGTALGVAFIAMVILLVIISVIKQRRRKRMWRDSGPRVLEQAAKVAFTDESVSGSSNEKSTIRPVEAGRTPRNSWFRYSSSPEVVHEMSAGEDEPSQLASNLMVMLKPKRPPVSSHF